CVFHKHPPGAVWVPVPAANFSTRSSEPHWVPVDPTPAKFAHGPATPPENLWRRRCLSDRYRYNRPTNQTPPKPRCWRDQGRRFFGGPPFHIWKTTTLYHSCW